MIHSKTDIQLKQRLRQKIFDLINTQKEEDASRKNQIILDKFLALPVFQKAKTVLFYVSCRGEVDTLRMIQRAIEMNKCVAVPKIVKDTQQIRAVVIESLTELKPGAFGIPEPEILSGRILPPGSIDVAVVPGVAFDRSLRRLGRGAGYYDRFLSTLPVSAARIGLAFDFQLVDEILGAEAHDQPVTHLVSN